MIIRKNSKKLLIIALIIIVVLFLLSLPKYDKEETALFEKYQAEFELVNNYILENFGHLENENILVVRDDEGAIDALYNNHKHIELTDELKRALGAIGEATHYNLNNIEVEKHRITYGGYTYRQYVFSRSGRIPDYYYHKGDGMNMTVYNLPGDWYLLTVHFI